jgi:glutathione S-transferase
VGDPHREFQEGEKIKFSGQGKVPVIIDNNKDGKWVNDSWAIAKYLESTYPDRPSLFNGPAGERPAILCVAGISRRGGRQHVAWVHDTYLMACTVDAAMSFIAPARGSCRPDGIWASV